MVKVLRLPLDCGIPNSELADGIVYSEDEAVYEPLLLEATASKPAKAVKAVVCGVMLDLAKNRRKPHADR